MPKETDRVQLRALLDMSAQLVEVLPTEEYEEDHLPGAISLPLQRVNAESVGVLDRSRPVIGGW